jgi:hypothetical protein
MVPPRPSATARSGARFAPGKFLLIRAFTIAPAAVLAPSTYVRGEPDERGNTVWEVYVTEAESLWREEGTR